MTIKGLYLLAKFKIKEFYSEERLKKHQEKKLREIVNHAYENVPYYRKLFKKLGISPEDIKTIDDLKKLPVLTKKDVREHAQSLIFQRKNSGADNLSVSTTTGSTGTPLKIYFNPCETEFGRALLKYGFSKSGKTLTDKFLHLYVPPCERKPRYIERLGLLRKYELDLRKPLREIIEKTNEIKPDIIYGYPSLFVLLGKFIKENNIRIHRPRIILTNGETLLSGERQLIETVFQCTVRSTYGSAEFWRIAYECEQGMLHLIPDSVIIELDNETLDKEDGSAELIITSLYQKTMPFIRYKIGDRAVLSEKKCKCGSKFRVIEQVVGRSDDYLTLPSGKKISARAINLREDIPGIIEYQIVQKKPEYFEVTLVPSKDFSEKSEKMIKNTITKGCLGEPVEIKVIKKEKLARTKTGKIRRITSEVK